MKLAYSPTSPYVRKVMVVLHETDQLADVALETRVTTPLAPDQSLLSSNPLGKVPALERAEGPALYDSRVICAYLNDRAGGTLYGSGARHWDILTLEATADGILDAALLMTYEWRMRPEDMRMDEWVDRQWDKVARGCAALNTRWMSHLAGPLDMGQIAVACALGYVDFRHDARGWRTGNDALAAWYAQFDSRPSMQATRPPAA
ncbi:glutathione S-transferase [Sulfitobacter sp. M57]|uniref:glutathione S-transferase n=1 Tax=unclassified Sulfitobacter TaxID=196795 RepID=UPI0023E1BEA6|nr:MULTISPECIES: glutathione S-transferase [unclassified Sulfitobacter]MDF3414859.1 glutathione S-transferase [Sulfitobacter sp. KE5]MDF3422340.1 glutathione S-transferase [Sulfitobacter sp. KE43]MDF3433405.1 glutathione S-transferase [Sulfitobacter sp. KE42]MDF3459045.1 glutathione S-transferase [Sulfitobacter sp. S74]MDF3462944.1 glutathione S-transferase [Sulfitobacter sp. Ks18]